MINKLEVSGVHMQVEQKLHDYIVKKIGRLDRFMPRQARESAHAEILIKQSKLKERRQHTCEVVLYLPKDTITVKETTHNPFAAVDIVEAKLKNLLKKHKDKHDSTHLGRRLFARIRRSRDTQVN